MTDKETELGVEGNEEVSIDEGVCILGDGVGRVGGGDAKEMKEKRRIRVF
jgi:hypothetical protein